MIAAASVVACVLRSLEDGTSLRNKRRFSGFAHKPLQTSVRAFLPSSFYRFSLFTDTPSSTLFHNHLFHDSGCAAIWEVNSLSRGERTLDSLRSTT